MIRFTVRDPEAEDLAMWLTNNIQVLRYDDTERVQ